MMSRIVDVNGTELQAGG